MKMTPWTQWLRVPSVICFFAALWDSLSVCHSAAVLSLTLQRSQLRWSYGVRLLSKAVPPDESTLPLLDEICPMNGGAGESENLRRDGFFGVCNTTQDDSHITAQTLNARARLQPGFTSCKADAI